MDPLAGSAWSAPGTVEGFAQSQPNPVLMQFGEQESQRRAGGCLLDIGCGAGRNAVPLARQGWQVTGLDLSWPMLEAAARRAKDEQVSDRTRFVLAPMDVLPVGDRTVDFLIAHGIWNLARSGAEFRRALAEAARVATPGAALFLFTFSRNTFPPGAAPIPGETFVFTQFSGQPQCFLTATQLVDELGAMGFVPDPAVAWREYNLPPPGMVRSGAPVIYECAFRYHARA